MKLNNEQIERADSMPNRGRGHIKPCKSYSDDYNPKKGIKCNVHNWVRRYIAKNVGRPYDKVQHEFIESMKANKDMMRLFDNHDYKQIFNSFIDQTEKPCDGGWNCCRWSDYYVDDHGAIQSRKKPNPPHTKDKVKTGRKAVYIHLREYAARYKQSIADVLKIRLPESDVYSMVSGDTITEEQYRRITDRIDDLKEAVALVNHIKERELEMGRCWCSRVYRLSGLFEYRIVHEYTTMTKKERITENAHFRQRNSAVLRDEKKRREEYNKNLLHELTMQQRAKEDELNRLQIERSGFDDATSFKGEEYHGGKRKKKRSGVS